MDSELRCQPKRLPPKRPPDWRKERPGKFQGLFCCEWECLKEADFLIIGNLNAGYDNDTYACEGHVGELLGTPDFLVGDNSEWVVSIIPEAEKLRWRHPAELVKQIARDAGLPMPTGGS